MRREFVEHGQCGHVQWQVSIIRWLGLLFQSTVAKEMPRAQLSIGRKSEFSAEKSPFQ
jgi:hypothetical protein